MELFYFIKNILLRGWRIGLPSTVEAMIENYKIKNKSWSWFKIGLGINKIFKFGTWSNAIHRSNCFKSMVSFVWEWPPKLYIQHSKKLWCVHFLDRFNSSLEILFFFFLWFGTGWVSDFKIHFGTDQAMGSHCANWNGYDIVTLLCDISKFGHK